MFQIDGLRGQLFVVTHSTDSLVDDYRNIIRFYRNQEGTVCTACGSLIQFSQEIEKHLIMHFPEVKEALYSRSVIIVEGETEYGCFGLFGSTLDIPFDYYGICLINARGESSIAKIRQLLTYFHIPTVVLYDADVKGSKTISKHTFFTDGICFEMDLAKTMIDHGKRRELDRIADTVNGEHARATTDMLKRLAASWISIIMTIRRGSCGMSIPGTGCNYTCTISPGCIAIKASSWGALLDKAWTKGSFHLLLSASLKMPAT